MIYWTPWELVIAVSSGKDSVTTGRCGPKVCANQRLLYFYNRFGTVILTHTWDGFCATLTNMLTVQRLLCCRLDFSLTMCEKAFRHTVTYIATLCNVWKSWMILCCECFWSEEFVHWDKILHCHTMHLHLFLIIPLLCHSHLLLLLWVQILHPLLQSLIYLFPIATITIAKSLPSSTYSWQWFFLTKFPTVTLLHELKKFGKHII